MLSRIIGLGLAVLIIGGLITPIGRGMVSGLLLLPEFFPGVPVRPLELLTPAPEHTTVKLSYDGKTALGDLYAPGTPGKHGAVVIFLGVAPAGRDDPRVIRLGEGLARVGLVTLVPKSQDLVDSKVDPTEIDEVVSAFQYLATRPDVASDRIGIGGFCIGAGLSLVAAEDPRINQQVALVNSFTGYDDLSTYAISILSHSVAPYPPEPGQTRIPWEPAANATAVLDDHLISLDPNPAEVALLRAAVHDPKAPKPDPKALSPIGQTVWTLLNTRDPATAEQLLRSLPPEDQAKLTILSPNTHLDQLHAKIFLMHDRDDTNVPVVQSRQLAAALPPDQVEYDEFQFFNHVDPTADVSPLIFVRDATRLAWHMGQILAILRGN